MKNTLSWLISGLALSFLMHFFFFLKMNQVLSPIATVDIDHIRGEFIHQLALQHVPIHQAHDLSNAFNQAMNQGLETIAQKNKRMILDKKYALTGTNDLTQELIERISKTMANQS